MTVDENKRKSIEEKKNVSKKWLGIVTGLQTCVGHRYGSLRVWVWVVDFFHTPRKTHTCSMGLSGFDGFVSAPSKKKKKKKTPKTEFLG